MSKYNYTKQDIINMCNKALKTPATFYSQDFIRSEDRLKDYHSVYRTEVIAAIILENLEDFQKGISAISRDNYKMLSHDGHITPTTQIEKNTAKKMFNLSKEKGLSFPYIGKIEDYETPLKNKRGQAVGDIDVLAVNREESTAFILELKKDGSPETMLRCVLEAYTYLKTVDKGKLFESFEIPEDYDLKAAPLIFKSGRPWDQMQEIDEHPNLKKLMDDLQVYPFYISELDEGMYVITKE